MNKKVVLAIALVTIGVFGRIVFRDILPSTPHIYININGVTLPIFMMDMFFLVAIISMLSGILLGKRYAVAVPFTVISLTDLYYGNNFILLFTWSGFIMLGLLGYIWRERYGISKRSAILSPILGAGAVIVYDIWTNFGCWLGWYPHNLEGLILCYTLALPFTLWHLVSTIAGLFTVSTILAVWKEHGETIKRKMVKKEVLPLDLSQ